MFHFNFILFSMRINKTCGFLKLAADCLFLWMLQNLTVHHIPPHIPPLQLIHNAWQYTHP